MRNGLFQNFRIHFVGFGERFSIVILDDGLLCNHLVEQARAELFEMCDAVAVAQCKRVSAFIDDGENGIRADFAVTEFIDEAFSGKARKPEAEERAGNRGKVRGFPHAFFERRAGRQALNPIGLNDARANAGDFAPAFRRGAGLVRGEKLCAQLGVELLTILHVSAEAAAGEHHSAAGADTLHAARGRLSEDIAFTNLNALNASFGASQDLLHEAARTGLDAERSEFFNGRHNNALARALPCDETALGGVAALAGKRWIPVHTDIAACPFKGFCGVFTDEPNMLRIAQTQTNALHVGHQSLRRVFDALLFLHARARYGEHAARKRGVAAHESHFFKYGS